MNRCFYCGNEKPSWRDKYITCSKKCSNAWSHLSRKEREKIRGKKYNYKK